LTTCASGSRLVYVHNSSEQDADEGEKEEPTLNVEKLLNWKREKRVTYYLATHVGAEGQLEHEAGCCV